MTPSKNFTLPGSKLFPEDMGLAEIQRMLEGRRAKLFQQLDYAIRDMITSVDGRDPDIDEIKVFLVHVGFRPKNSTDEPPEWENFVIWKNKHVLAWRIIMRDHISQKSNAMDHEEVLQTWRLAESDWPTCVRSFIQPHEAQNDRSPPQE